jgi:hypothetical protein
MTERSPLLPLARLWAKTSAKGTPYMVGRLSMAKLVLLPVREEQSDGHTHELCAQSSANHPRAGARQRAMPKRDGKVSIDDDPVPF